MFRKKWPNRIVSDEGFEVKTVGHGTILYVEGKREIRLNSEMLSDGGYVLYKDSIRYWSEPYRSEIIEVKEAVEILQRIIDAFNFEGTKLEVI